MNLNIYINVCLCIRLIDKRILWNKNKNSRYGGHGLRSLVTSGLQNFFELLLSFKDKMALLLLLPRLLPPFIQERRRCYIHKQGIHQRPQDERALHIYIYMYNELPQLLTHYSLLNPSTSPLSPQPTYTHTPESFSPPTPLTSSTPPPPPNPH